MLLRNREAITRSGLLVTMPVPGIVRVTDGSHRESFMVSARRRSRLPPVSGDRLTWGNVSVEPENGMALYWKGRMLCQDYPGRRNPRTNISQQELDQLREEGHSFVQLNDDGKWKVEVVKALPPDAAVYGLGDKTGFLNKRNYAYVNWNTDNAKPHCDNFQSLYKSVNFFMVYGNNGCVGILADNTFRTRFDFGKEQPDYYYWSHEDGGLDYYMIPGDNPKEVLKRYLALTGEPMLQQKWVYGFHQSRRSC